MTNLVKDRFFTKVIEDFRVMSIVVLKQVGYVMDLFEDTYEDNPEIYQEIYNNERIIDSLDVKLRREMIDAIVLYQPKATELRQMMGFYDMTSDMERMGDQVMNIARMVKGMNLSGEICTKYRTDISKLLKKARKMVKHSVKSFDTGDSQLAKLTIEKDEQVDIDFHALLNNLRSDNSGQTFDDTALNDLFCIHTIAHCVERIADYATNVSEATIYMTDGRDIKHSEFKTSEAIELLGHLPEDAPESARRAIGEAPEATK